MVHHRSPGKNIDNDIKREKSGGNVHLSFGVFVQISHPVAGVIAVRTSKSVV